ncbi:ABC transporter permease [Aerosakkonemataceae cyanobacterium BLCC-F154]|uniref:ABC transporter permease n=1 Tax=Floridaenema fluviatile BLCC-F154 TaxID=3153640 RepID=A0ABV4YB86_9CYAN
MKSNWLDRIGDLNPQMWREIKGRFKTRNLIVAAIISLLGQFTLLMMAMGGLPTDDRNPGSTEKNYHKYCTGISQECLQDGLGNFVINWQLWWIEIFTVLSVIGIFVLLVAGTYMLIIDLAKEEKNGTLNFIRLSPRTSQSILFGKILGVPFLLYVFAAFALPLHFWAGISAGIPFMGILIYWAVIVASCFFFYSTSLLFGLFSSAFSGVQPWLGSGLVLMFLLATCSLPIANLPTDWINLFSPYTILSYVVNASPVENSFSFSYLNLDSWQWFYFPLGSNAVATISFSLFNYALWSYWIWQGLQRRFHNPTKTVLNKGQSYSLVVCVEIMFLGFALQANNESYSRLDSTESNFLILLILNQLLFLGLIAILSVQRQALQDWARYRRERIGNRWGFWSRDLIKDLLWAEKSPSILAIAINLVVTFVILSAWVVFSSSNWNSILALPLLAVTMSLILIYATIVQLILLMRAKKRMQWAAVVVIALVVLPPIFLGVLSVSPDNFPLLWLFTVFPWAVTQNASDALVGVIFTAFVCQLGIFAVLNGLLNRQLKVVGKSETKALLK